ncbi:uncharacterized protein ImpE1 [Anabrus simplex]|uniref:uncharacterized protein ImpE1 n=1 Tax=Anabrus simplex TaxID=316456 RepID=UPI0035A3C81E
MNSVITKSAFIYLVACALACCETIAGHLGSKCNSDRECASIVPHSRCSHGICSCQPYFAKYNTTRCLPSSLLGFSCLVKEQCSLKVANSSCIQGMCRCQPGFLQFRRHTCLSPARPTEVCYSDAHCRLWNADTHCDFLIPKLFGRCRCNSPLKQKRDSCFSVDAEIDTTSSTEKNRLPVSHSTTILSDNTSSVSSTHRPAVTHGSTSDSYATSSSVFHHIPTSTSHNTPALLNDNTYESSTRAPSLVTENIDGTTTARTVSAVTLTSTNVTVTSDEYQALITSADIASSSSSPQYSTENGTPASSGTNNKHDIMTTGSSTSIELQQDEATSQVTADNYIPTKFSQPVTQSYLSVSYETSAATEGSPSKPTHTTEISSPNIPSTSEEYALSTESSTERSSQTVSIASKPISSTWEYVTRVPSTHVADDQSFVTEPVIFYGQQDTSTSTESDEQLNLADSSSQTTVFFESSSESATEEPSSSNFPSTAIEEDVGVTSVSPTSESEPQNSSTLVQDINTLFPLSPVDLVTNWPVPTEQLSSSVPPDVTLMTHLLWSPLSDLKSTPRPPGIYSSMEPMSEGTLEPVLSTSETTEEDLLAASTVLLTAEPARLRGEESSVSLGLPCVVDAQCQAADNNSRCIQGRCDCARRDNSSNGCSALNRGCHSSTFQCRASGACISWFFVCDGRRDCTDGSDEECSGDSCPSQAFRCGLTGVCVSRAGRCDGVLDCPAGEDEAGCTPARGRCPDNSFRCSDGTCLPEYEYCNAVVTCSDGSDEPPAACKARGRRNSAYCPFRCDNGRCRSTAILCSGRDGCGDHSDEAHCSVCKCPAVH